MVLSFASTHMSNTRFLSLITNYIHPKKNAQQHDLSRCECILKMWRVADFTPGRTTSFRPWLGRRTSLWVWEKGVVQNWFDETRLLTAWANILPHVQRFPFLALYVSFNILFTSVSFSLLFVYVSIAARDGLPLNFVAFTRSLRVPVPSMYTHNPNFLNSDWFRFVNLVYSP
jgi:hypothetical protein